MTRGMFTFLAYCRSLIILLGTMYLIFYFGTEETSGSFPLLLQESHNLRDLAYDESGGFFERPRPQEHFLLIQPTSLDFKNLERAKEIRTVHGRNERMFTDILHPNERNFRKLFDLTREDKINIVANGDIFFDDRSQLQRLLEIPNGVCYALSRWEQEGDGEIFDRADSQDVWIFRGRLNLSPEFANYSMGTRGCNNRLVWELEQSGYTVESV